MRASKLSKMSVSACRSPIVPGIVTVSTVVSENKIVSAGGVLIVSGMVPVRVKVRPYERRNVVQDFRG